MDYQPRPRQKDIKENTIEDGNHMKRRTRILYDSGDLDGEGEECDGDIDDNFDLTV